MKYIKLPNIYDSHMMMQYKGAAFGELSPLPFAVADAAHRYISNPVLEASCKANTIRNNNPVISVNLWRFNLTREEGF
ncbi:unnamed protein product [Ilex paraguariensis]|uniref:Myosin motor domain-containing protein n=1 Tax=Ilex paraguariensis TaxID=185542 RepID=A0ABC8QLD6_9AQUA